MKWEAKPVRQVVVGAAIKANDGHSYFGLWVDSKYFDAISEHPGVLRVDVHKDIDNKCSVHVDPRYNVDDVIKDVETFLDIEE